MSGRFSKEKGKRFERELARALRSYGYEARRSAQYNGKTGEAADLLGMPGLHIEAKHCEKMRLYDWYDQAKRDASGTGYIPIVVHRQNNKETLVTMSLEHFITIYREWEVGYDATAKGS